MLNSIGCQIVENDSFISILNNVDYMLTHKQ